MRSLVTIFTIQQTTKKIQIVMTENVMEKSYLESKRMVCISVRSTEALFVLLASGTENGLMVKTNDSKVEEGCTFQLYSSFFSNLAQF